ncbi:MAG: hypothetical protein M3409_02850 [Gemmatimonadota bacterium]|jgi:hypothetical protein|nr:hypothetical protein [Gemmatimonadota bacterium]
MALRWPQHRSVTSLFSNLVTRPTGRAIRMGVESQIAELPGAPASARLSVLDFSQVRILDYSCADEIVAKLLLRYQDPARPCEVFFVVRDLQEHHLEAVETVLERHGLLVVTEDDVGAFHLLGSGDVLLQSCWETLLRIGRSTAEQLAREARADPPQVRDALDVLCAQRVALRYPDGAAVALPSLLHE